MALSQCIECGKEISSDAASCPHCGLRTQNGVHRSRRPVMVTVIVGCALCAFLAGVFVFDSVLVWLPIPYSEGLYSIDWKEMGIGFAMLAVPFIVVLLAVRWSFAVGHAMRRYGYIAATFGVFTLSFLLGFACHWKIDRAHWFTRNEVVFATIGGKKEGRILRHRVIMFLPKPAQVLKARVVRLNWDSMAAGTKVRFSDNSEGTVSSDLVGVKLSLEIRNTSSSPTRLMSAPYIGTGKRIVFKLHMPLHGFSGSDFSDDGVALRGSETKVLEFESGMEGYDEVKAAGDLFVMHSSYDYWREKLSPLPARDAVFKKKRE